MKRILFLLSCIALFYSCSKDKDSYIDESKKYFPLEIGKQVIYEVDSIIWDDFTGTVDTHHYEMRWTITDTFRDNASRLCHTIEVELRDSTAMNWEMHHVMYVMANETRLEYQEENLRFIKLIFPIEDGRSWDGNVEISTNSSEYQFLQAWKYTYAQTGQPYHNGILQFDQTVTVNAIDKEENIPKTDPYAYKIFAQEVYAKEVGMVYREMTYWVYDEHVSAYLSSFSVVMRAKEHN